MKMKSVIMSSALMALFAMSTIVKAIETDGGSSRDGGGMGDNTRERGEPSSRGQGELNRDNDTQSAQRTAASGKAPAGSHSVGSLGIGEPTDPNYSYNRTRQEMMSHD